MRVRVKVRSQRGDGAGDDEGRSRGSLGVVQVLGGPVVEGGGQRNGLVPFEFWKSSIISIIFGHVGVRG